VGNDQQLSPLTTEDIKLDEQPRWIAEKIFKNCSGYYDRIDVWRAETFDYVDNGIGLFLRFIGRNGDHAKMKIVSGVDVPLTQGSTVSADQLEYNSTKVVNASKSLFYESIPFEMLRTHETKPQVVVQVGDYPAVCKNLTCHYNYTVPEGIVTGFTYTAATRQLQLQGTDLPVNASMIRKVEFAHSLCTLT